MEKELLVENLETKIRLAQKNLEYSLEEFRSSGGRDEAQRQDIEKQLRDILSQSRGLSDTVRNLYRDSQKKEEAVQEVEHYTATTFSLAVKAGRYGVKIGKELMQEYNEMGYQGYLKEQIEKKENLLQQSHINKKDLEKEIKSLKKTYERSETIVRDNVHDLPERHNLHSQEGMEI